MLVLISLGCKLYYCMAKGVSHSVGHCFTFCWTFWIIEF